MWGAAIDLLFCKMLEDNFDFKSVLAIGSSAQQHGSVYLNHEFLKPVNQIAKSNLADIYSKRLSRLTFPIWMDACSPT